MQIVAKFSQTEKKSGSKTNKIYDPDINVRSWKEKWS